MISEFTLRCYRDERAFWCVSLRHPETGFGWVFNTGYRDILAALQGVARPVTEALGLGARIPSARELRALGVS